MLLYAEALDKAVTCMQVAERMAENGPRAMASWMLGMTRLRMGRLVEARAHLERALCRNAPSPLRCLPSARSAEPISTQFDAPPDGKRGQVVKKTLSIDGAIIEQGMGSKMSVAAQAVFVPALAAAARSSN